MGQAEKFMKCSSIYSDMWEVEQSKSGPQYFIPEKLHQQYDKMLVAGNNITESLICPLYEKNLIKSYQVRQKFQNQRRP